MLKQAYYSTSTVYSLERIIPKTKKAALSGGFLIVVSIVILL